MQNKIVLITGATSGIGASCARMFAQAGSQLILLGRRQERLERMAEELSKEFSISTYLLQLDVRDRAAVESVLSSLPESWANIDVLINNAGLSRGMEKLQEGNVDNWDEMIDTNVKGLLYVTRQIVPTMVKQGYGHVVNIGSLAGHQTYPGGNVYCGSKAAVKAISEGLKQDLLGTPVRVTLIDPGMVETEFSVVRFRGDAERAKGVYNGMTPLTPDDIAEVILFCVTRPDHVNISDVVLMPTDQSSATMVYRKA
jgi:serine 3-dehydrogenase